MLHIKTGTQNNYVDGKAAHRKIFIVAKWSKKKDKLCLLDLGCLDNSIPSTSLIESWDLTYTTLSWSEIYIQETKCYKILFPD